MPLGGRPAWCGGLQSNTLCGMLTRPRLERVRRSRETAPTLAAMGSDRSFLSAHGDKAARQQPASMAHRLMDLITIGTMGLEVVLERGEQIAGQRHVATFGLHPGDQVAPAGNDPLAFGDMPIGFLEPVDGDATVDICAGAAGRGVGSPGPQGDVALELERKAKKALGELKELDPELGRARPAGALGTAQASFAAMLRIRPHVAALRI